MRFSSFQKELRPAGTMSSSSSLVLCCTSRMFASTSSVRAGSMCFKTCFGAFTCSTLKKLGLSELQYRNVTTVLTRDLDSRPDEWFNYAAKRISHLYLLCLYIEEQTNVIIGLFVKDLSV